MSCVRMCVSSVRRHTASCGRVMSCVCLVLARLCLWAYGVRGGLCLSAYGAPFFFAHRREMLNVENLQDLGEWNSAWDRLPAEMNFLVQPFLENVRDGVGRIMR